MVKNAAAQIIIKPIQPSKMIIIRRLMCVFVPYNGQQKDEIRYFEEKMSLHINTVLLSGSPVSNEITQQ